MPSFYAGADEHSIDITWATIDKNGIARVHLYFYWSKHCPHCRDALPFLEKLAAAEPWVVLHSRELTEHPENVREYTAVAAALGQEARSVPAFFWCGNMVVGYDDEQGMGRFLRERLSECRDGLLEKENAEALQSPHPAPMTLPLLGNIQDKDWSLPVYTVVLAGFDAFNPCAFFVLLFLLSLLVHAGSRARMFLIGGIFVFFSGLLYFVFMAAWLNVFLVIGEMNSITAAAGSIAVVIAVINIKDFFWFGRGVTLSIPDKAKPGLFQRLRALVNTEKQTTMIAAAMSLAAFANLYEFLCTAGFPMVFTRILTLHQLPASAYYAYLLLYNVIYVIPLFVIVALFAVTLGGGKLQEEQGRRMKLLSGVMMLGLGLVLIMDANWLSNAAVAFALLAGATVLSGVIVALERRIRYGR